MLKRIKHIFSGEWAWPVECFGKLPCYQDYISLVITKGASPWRDWLLAYFHETLIIPEGVWRFVFEPHKNCDPVVGLIQASSDGRREFPFSLFVVGDRKLTGSLAALHAVWEELAALHWQLVAAPNVQGIYNGCAGRKVTVAAEMARVDDGPVMPPDTGPRPRLSVVEKVEHPNLHLLWQAGMSPEMLEHGWQALKPNA